MRRVLLLAVAGLVMGLVLGTAPAAVAQDEPVFTPPVEAQRHLTGQDAQDLSVTVSRARFADGTAAVAVLARADVFADSLAGTPLTGDGPLLFTVSDALEDRPAQELGRVLPAGSTVYLLGGTAALSPAVEDTVRAQGFLPRRLAGPSRVHTALAVAQEVLDRTGSRTVAVARDDGWADSVSAGAWASAEGHPIVVTGGSTLHPDVATWLSRQGWTDAVVLGGTAALSPDVADAVGRATLTTPRRVAGDTRDTTAAEIARVLRPGWASATVVNGFDTEGWVAGLAAAGLAGDDGGALFLSYVDRLPSSTRDGVAAVTCPMARTAGTIGQLHPSAMDEVDDAAGC